MSDAIKHYMQRPKFYANIDGTSEMSFGLPLLGLALVSYLQAALPMDSICGQLFKLMFWNNLSVRERGRGDLPCPGCGLALVNHR